MFYNHTSCSQGVPSPKAKPAAQALGGGALYPNLLADYSVISMPSLEDCDMKKLLPMAVELSTSLSNNMSSLEKVLHKSNKGITINAGCVKCICLWHQQQELGA